MDASENIVRPVDRVRQQDAMIETKLKVIDVTSKVLEAIEYKNVILPTAKRLHMVRI